MNRNLIAVRDTDKGRSIATKTGKVVHCIDRVYAEQARVETSCHKFLNVITPEHVTLEQKKRRWGVMVGADVHTNRLTCRSCQLTREAEQKAEQDPQEVAKEQALQNISAVAATPAGHAELGRAYQRDPQEAQIGDIVYIYSRGMYRRAIVTKVTATKIHAIYTTDGAVKEAQRIYDSNSAIDPEADRKRAYTQGLKTWDSYARDVRQYRPLAEAGTLKSWKSDILRTAELVTAQDREEYAETKAQEQYERSVKRLAANTSYRVHLTYTTKAANKDEVYLV